MERCSHGPALALVFFASLYAQSSFAITCSTNGGVSIIGTEYYAAPQTPSGGQYNYQVANLQCTGGVVTMWLNSSVTYKPEDLLALMKQQNLNMDRYFTNKCGTHIINAHNNFKGVIDGVALSSFTKLKTTYVDEFARPIYYASPAALLCPDVPDLGNPDTPGVCPIESASPALPTSGSASKSGGNPVNIATGNKFQTEVDYGGRSGSGLRLVRYYNSKTAKWTHSYSAVLKISPTQILLTTADGADSLFSVSGTTVTAPPRELGSMEKTASGWLYHSPQGEHLHFDTLGKLTRIDRANGDYENLTYPTNQIVVTDSSGTALTLTVNAQKRITNAAVGTLQITYIYNTAGLPSTVTRTQAGQSVYRTYHYEDARDGGWLTGITDERGVRYVTWEYDTQGRVKKNVLHNNASQYLFTYNSNGSTTVTNPLNKQTTYTFQTVAGAQRITSLTGAESANCPSSNSSFTYDSRGLIETKIDNKGYLTTYDYNSRGLEESRTEASGTPQERTITTVWHPTLYRPSTITEPDRVLTYQYDDYGNLLGQTVTAP